MKKTYFVPTTEVVNLQSKPIMNIGSTSDTQAAQGASNFSRGSGRNSSWDDDED